MAALPIHLRAKRGKQTIFVVSNPADSVRLIKSKISAINNIAAERIRIIAADKTTVYEDESTVADHLLKDNDIIYFVCKPESGDFEDLSVVPYGADEGGAEEKK